MHRPLIALNVIVALALIGGAQAAELGTKAAPLDIAKWVKGEPVDLSKTDGKQVTVVEFWATWCPPCIASIPHLTELQKKYKDKNVRVIGISDESPSVVSSFVSRQGDKIGYTVAVDNNRKTSKGYMEAFGIPGIPHAFIVDQKGKVVWHDHPSGNLEEVLDLVVAGKFDNAAREKLVADRKAREAKQRQAIEAIDKYATGLLEGKSLVDLRKHAETFMKLAGNDHQMLNQVAWQLMMDPQFPVRDMDLIETMAKQAVDITKGEDANVLDTYAYALHKNGKTAEAIKVQEKAIKLAQHPEMKKVLEKHLAEFKSQS